jgi:UDP-N-acetyl-D-glucosamine/UDP-N-acetyl-D-galactosamine dehydrogenase
LSVRRHLSIVGLGYVGLPVAVAFGRHEKVIGFDIDQTRIEELKRGEDRTREVDAEALGATDVLYTSTPEDLARADFHIIAVPTPVDVMKQPDLGPLLAATRTVGQHLKRGDIVVFESTVFPGATEECCVPVLERESGLKLGADFGVGYSPERINPGDRVHRLETICKIVSGSSAPVLDIVASVYESVVEAGVFRAASVQVAEAAKVIENTQRDINIALMNELAVIFAKLGIDTRDVLAAAGTKWNFLTFEPGLVGGHCIGVDPYYLTHKAMAVGHSPEVINAGRRINDSVGGFIARAVIRELLRAPSRNGQLEVCILGLSFKENVPDLRNSRVVDVVEELADYGIAVTVCDPLADTREAAREYGLQLAPFEDLPRFDGVVLAVAHEEFRAAGWPAIQARLREEGGIVFDVKGILPRADTPENVTLLRL